VNSSVSDAPITIMHPSTMIRKSEQDMADNIKLSRRNDIVYKQC